MASDLADDLARDLELGERLFDYSENLTGRTIAEIDRLEREFSSAKLDVSLAWVHLTASTVKMRRLAGLPDDAAPGQAHAILETRKAAGDLAAAHGLLHFDTAAAVFEQARAVLADVRARA